MQLTVLGSGTVAPTAHRTAAAYWVEAGSTRLLLDCGPGILHRAATFGIPWPQATHVAITHFHADHWTELPFFIFAQRWGTEPARASPLHVVGPPGLEERWSHMVRAFGPWLDDPGYSLTLMEIDAGQSVHLTEDVTLETCKTPHTDESIAYAVSHAGCRLVYTGDTGPSDAVAAFADGCDVLLCECSLPDDRAVAVHLTPAQAGEMARLARAKLLVLTHFYPPVERVDPAVLAAAVYGGEVVAARDGDQFMIGDGPC